MLRLENSSWVATKIYSASKDFCNTAKLLKGTNGIL